MRKFLIISTFLAVSSYACCQKFYVAPNLGAQFASLSYFPKGANPYVDLSMPRPHFVPTIGLNLYYQTRHFTHRFAAQYLAFGIGFNFKTYNTVVKSNVGRFPHTGSLDHAVISYAIQKDFTGKSNFAKTKKFFHASLGIGVGTNRSKAYYEELYVYESFQATSTNGDYSWWEYYPKREKLGLFLMPEFGITFRNKKKKDCFVIDAFYYKGLQNMVSYDLRYGHGNPNDNVMIEHRLPAKSRGTVFGIKIGVPIHLGSKK